MIERALNQYFDALDAYDPVQEGMAAMGRVNARTEADTAALAHMRGLGVMAPSAQDYDYGAMWQHGYAPKVDDQGRIPLPPQFFRLAQQGFDVSGFVDDEDLAISSSQRAWNDMTARLTPPPPLDVLDLGESAFTGEKVDVAAFPLRNVRLFSPLDTVTSGAAMPADALRTLREQSFALEGRTKGSTLYVTEDGKAIISLTKGAQIPDAYAKFAQDNGLEMVLKHSSFNKRTTMPAEYRLSGARYAHEYEDGRVLAEGQRMRAAGAGAGAAAATATATGASAGDEIPPSATFGAEFKRAQQAADRAQMSHTWQPNPTVENIGAVMRDVVTKNPDVSWGDLALGTAVLVGGTPADVVNLALMLVNLDTDKPVMGDAWIYEKLKNAGYAAGKRDEATEIALSMFVGGGMIKSAARELATRLKTIAKPSGKDMAAVAGVGSASHTGDSEAGGLPGFMKAVEASILSGKHADVSDLMKFKKKQHTQISQLAPAWDGRSIDFNPKHYTESRVITDNDYAVSAEQLAKLIHGGISDNMVVSASNKYAGYIRMLGTPPGTSREVDLVLRPNKHELQIYSAHYTDGLKTSWTKQPSPLFNGLEIPKRQAK